MTRAHDHSSLPVPRPKSPFQATTCPTMDDFLFALIRLMT
ncbi:hypothetical protein EI77_00823 [Prosthecobacter fusiformis]|uniref:Uncharacterized protein n=1 Tax=Prosthecobacter fusiformis TaxID=48464 RepID=A0A4V3FI93_9BACT|nr:hypothetical protein EI77_00823 [Prosthecobacter fusiformis]